MIVERIFISSGHAYFGRHGQGAAPHSMEELAAVEAVAGLGLRGDRFFGYKENYRGQVTLFSREVWDELCLALGAAGAHPAATRRNLLVSGADLNPLIGQCFQLQEVQLQGVEECRPCYWMDQAIAPGAEAWLRGRGGLRCRILGTGTFRAARSEATLAA